MDKPIKHKPGKWPISRRQVLKASAVVIVAAEALPLGVTGLTATALAQPVTTSIAGYILKRLAERRVKALFAVPGATCDRLLRAAVAQSFPIIATSSDLEAGQAADPTRRRCWQNRQSRRPRQALLAFTTATKLRPSPRT